MQIHSIVSEHLHKDILPYILQVQDVAVPYPAELWENENCNHKTGSVVFNIKGDRLLAEYFAHDIYSPSFPIMIDDTQWKIVLKGTGAEIPIGWIQESNKARTVYSSVSMPLVQAYECEIQGWLGDPESRISSATIAITDLPSLRLPSGTQHLPKEILREGLSHIKTETWTSVLTLDAGDWEIDLMEHNSPQSEQIDLIHTVLLRKEDGASFTLCDEENIILALRQFLSFQAGLWVNIPTIVCDPSDLTDWVIKRAFVGKLACRNAPHRTQWLVSDYRDWPSLFREFWKRRTRNTNRLNNTIHHFVECSEIFQGGHSTNYSAVAARSTLEALIRWWNNLQEDYEFSGKDGYGFSENLMRAVEKAELGKDVGRQIDDDELRGVIDRASKLRNRIDHGLAGNIDAGERKSIIAYQQYMHNLARLLILAKLGDRKAESRGSFYSPRFKETLR